MGIRTFRSFQIFKRLMTETLDLPQQHFHELTSSVLLESDLREPNIFQLKERIIFSFSPPLDTFTEHLLKSEETVGMTIERLARHTIMSPSNEMCCTLLHGARFGVHFFLGSPGISYIISTDIDRNQLL